MTSAYSEHGFMLWFAYGVVNRDVPIIVTNVVSLVVAATLLVTTHLYGRGSTADAGLLDRGRGRGELPGVDR